MGKLSLKNIIQILIAILISAFLLRLFVLSFSYIPTNSMNNTLIAGDYVFISKLHYSLGFPPGFRIFNIALQDCCRLKWREVKRGDLIIFESPADINPEKVSKEIVKRVAGVPGDDVKIINGLVYVNGKIYPAFKNSGTTEIIPENETEKAKSIIIPQKGALLKFDINSITEYRNIILRDNGKIEIKDNNIYINDRASNSYRVSQNFYFVLGDNPSDSYDSRDWGLLPESCIIGKPIFIYLSISKNPSTRKRQINFDRILSWVK